MCMLVLVKCMHVGRHDRQPDHEQRCCLLKNMNVLYLGSTTMMSLLWYTASQLALCIESLLISEIKHDQQPYWTNQLCVQYVCVNCCNNSIHILWCLYFFPILCCQVGAILGEGQVGAWLLWALFRQNRDNGISWSHRKSLLWD